MAISISSGAQVGHCGGGWLSRDAGKSNRIITRPYARMSSPGAATTGAGQKQQQQQQQPYKASWTT